MALTTAHLVSDFSNSFITMVEEKLIERHRFHLALMDINQYLKSEVEGIQHVISKRFLKEVFNWGYDKWSDSYTKAHVPFAERHGLLDEKCRVYFLYMMKMAEKRGREYFGEEEWSRMTALRRKRMLKLSPEARAEFFDCLADVDTCPYTIMEQAEVPMYSVSV